MPTGPMNFLGNFHGHIRQRIGKKIRPKDDAVGTTLIGITVPMRESGLASCNAMLDQRRNEAADFIIETGLNRRASGARI